MSLTAQDYRNAIDVQNACNLSGVVFSFAKVMQKICDEARDLGKGTDWKNNHPIAVLYASKVSSLAGDVHAGEYSKAYDACAKNAEELKEVG